MKLKLASRMLLYFGLLAAALLITVGTLSYRSGRKNLESAAVLQVVTKTIKKEAALDAWIEERLADIQRLASEGDLVEGTARFTAAATGSAAERSAREFILKEMQPHVTGTYSGFIELFVIEPEGGTVLVSTRPSEEGKLKRGHPYFDKGRNGLYLQPAYDSEDLKVPTMTAAIPLRAGDGRLVAVLAARLDLGALSAIVQRRTGLHETEDAFLINSGRFLVTQPRFLAKPGILVRQLDTEAVRRCAARNSGLIFAQGYRGVPTIAAYRWNARHQFGLIVKIDQAEALAPVHAFGRNVILISSLALVASALLALLLARTITRPLRELQEGVKQFNGKNLVAPLRETSHDEVGVLAHEFNQMSARVAERTAELDKSNTALLLENTERKRTEESLRAAQQLIEGIINAIPVRIFWKDKNLVYLGCNAVFAHDAGFAEPQDIIGKDDYQKKLSKKTVVFSGRIVSRR